MKEKSKALYKLVIISMSVAFITVCSWISIPFAVNFSLQIFALLIIAAALPFSVSITSISIYILLGFIGIPVFSGFSSGLTALMGASGGFIIAFLPMAFTVSIFRKKYVQHPWIFIVISFISMLICYISGCLWYMLIFSPSTSFLSALAICVIPFIIPDTLKILLSSIALKKLNPYIKKLQL